MFVVLEVVTLVLVAVAVALALAHALELPGKLRLGREAYLAVQPIYYPGFTVAGISEPLAIVMILVLLLLVPPGTPAFWFALGALAAVAAMHAVYWLVTHPVNNFWLAGTSLDAASTRFFAAGSGGDAGSDWTRLRDRWEYSHVARTGVGLIGLVLIAAAVAV